jgi:hypothetical protein
MEDDSKQVVKCQRRRRTTQEENSVWFWYAVLTVVNL